tara:strand:+ start:111 stop:380 length:270 start_codon:yes stop_codon:yes gene_type:complete
MLIDLEQIKEILKKIDDFINVDELEIENDLFGDHFLDSLQAVEFFIILDEKFDFNIDEYEKKIKNYKVKSLIEYINGKTFSEKCKFNDF